MKAFVLFLLMAAAPEAPPTYQNWCIVGHKVMVPDGRVGPVLAVSGDICMVLIDGEKYVSQWAYYLIEPVYPQKLPTYRFSH